MTVTINVVDTTPQLDPYHADTGQETRTEIWVDPQQRRCVVSQEYDDNATPMNEWHGITLAQLLPKGVRPDQDALRTYLKDEAQPLLDAICDNHRIEWDGSNHKGSLNHEGQQAWDTLIKEIGSLPYTQWQLWDTEDWLYEWAREYVTTDTTDEQLEALAGDAEMEALNEKVILTGSAFDYLLEFRTYQEDNYE